MTDVMKGPFRIIIARVSGSEVLRSHPLTVKPTAMFSVSRKVVPVRALKRSLFSMPDRGKQSLVILGSGWGGYEVLRGVDKKKWSLCGLESRVFAC